MTVTLLNKLFAWYYVAHIIWLTFPEPFTATAASTSSGFGTSTGNVAGAAFNSALPKTPTLGAGSLFSPKKTGMLLVLLSQHFMKLESVLSSCASRLAIIFLTVLLFEKRIAFVQQDEYLTIVLCATLLVLHWHQIDGKKPQQRNMLALTCRRN